MTEKKITEKTKLAALENGADMVGVLNVINLPEHSERIERMLPGKRFGRRREDQQEALRGSYL